MKIFSSCHEAVQACLQTKTFSIAHLFSVEKTMDMHIHDFYEVYYSISGGKQFLINDHLYNFKPGDIFFISHDESHHITQIEEEAHERYVLNIHPQYVKQVSSSQTDLSICFASEQSPFAHKVSLSPKEQQRFLYLIHKLSSTSKDFGQEILEQATFLELMVFFNEVFLQNCHALDAKVTISNNNYEKCAEILTYINQNLTSDLNIATLSKHFLLSPSYLSMIFKKETGTAIQKYITGQRIALAKRLLTEGHSVTETCMSCGFGDYSNFLKTFTKMVGVSPKKFAQFSSE